MCDELTSYLDEGMFDWADEKGGYTWYSFDYLLCMYYTDDVCEVFSETSCSSMMEYKELWNKHWIPLRNAFNLSRTN